MDKSINQAVGREIKQARLEKGLTVKALAEELDISSPNVGLWERGAGLPIYQNAVRVDKILGTDIAERYRPHLKGAPAVAAELAGEAACSKASPALEVEQPTSNCLEDEVKKAADALPIFEVLSDQQKEKIVSTVLMIAEALKCAAVAFSDCINKNIDEK